MPCERASWCPERWNRIVNNAPLSAETNRFIGGDPPSRYSTRIEKNKHVPVEDLNAFLASHMIPVPEFRADDFEEFIRRRASALLDSIEASTGKAVSGRDSEETVKAFGGALV